jgi:nicotinate dehydrogenase subunit A
MVRIVLRINGELRETEADPSAPLLYVLRDNFGLTGAKLGCGLEQCGACAVLVDGRSQLSCSSPAVDFEGAEIKTVEGLSSGGEPGAVQRAFVAEAAAQCGFCTPGLVIAVEALRRAQSNADENAVRQALANHLCRCGTQAAVLRAARRVLTSPSGQ